MFKPRTCLLAAVCVFASAFAGKADVVYIINQTGIGFDHGSVTGTIETDGTFGSLTAGNIVTWSLQAIPCNGVMSCPASNFNLTGGAGGNSTIVTNGSDELSATPTQLFYNFGVSGTFLGSFEIVNGSNAWALGLTDSSNTFEEILPLGLNGNAGPRSGSQVIGTAQAAPEPASFFILAAGLIGFGACRRKRRPGGNR